MQQVPLVRGAAALSLGAGLSFFSACTTAASAGDGAIRMASFGRVQATPFTDTLDTRDCREALDATYGFSRESRGMKSGVFVVQTYDCEADRVVARVSLNNYTEHAMSCFAETDTGRHGATMAPGAPGFFEYSFAHQVFLDCTLAN